MTDPIPNGWRLCVRCAGSGRIVTVLWTLPCPACEGTGLVVKPPPPAPKERTAA